MRYKVVAEIQEARTIKQYLEGLSSNTAIIILYMEDGTVIEWDLTNPQLPLPSCRAPMIIP